MPQPVKGPLGGLTPGLENDIVGTAKGSQGSGVVGFSVDQSNEGHLGEVGFGVRGAMGQPAGGQLMPASAGVFGYSDTTHGVYGWSASGDVWKGSNWGANHWLYSGVSGVNAGGGHGVSGVSEGGYGVYALSYQSYGLYVLGGGKGPAAHIEGHLEINGDISNVETVNVKNDMILQGGMDCAEQFDTENGLQIEPGTVVVITSEGTLEVCREAYDKKVAGVVSGAGDYKPAIILDRRPSRSDRTLVALVGKVCCKADAKYGPIGVGDLLTTSLTPGHAMKATEPTRVFGSVIGKALKALERGKGLIPILVALQ